MDLVTFGLGITTGTGSGGNRRQWEAMALVTFGLGTTTGTGSAGNTCTNVLHMFTCTYACWEMRGMPCEAVDFVTFGPDITTGTSSGGNGMQLIGCWESRRRRCIW